MGKKVTPAYEPLSDGEPEAASPETAPAQVWESEAERLERLRRENEKASDK